MQIKCFENKYYVCALKINDLYRDECGLITYNRPIPDFEIPVAGNLVDDILDLTYHLSQGRNCLVHCAGQRYE